MPDRVPLPTIAGLLNGFVAVDLPIAYFAAAQTLEGVYPTLADPPAGGTIVLDVRTATGGGGSGITATIPDTLRSPATEATGSVTVAAGDTLYLRITADNSGSTAMNLGGYITVSAAVGAVTALTTLALVKAYKGITVSTDDTLLNTLIAGVSADMQDYLRRSIVSVAITGEKHDGHDRDTLILDDFPIIVPPAVAVTDRNGDAVDTTKYEVDEDAGMLIKVDTGVPGIWEKGRRNFTAAYTAGFAAVPPELSLAATKQAVYEFQKTTPGGGRIGDLGEALDAGGSLNYRTGKWAEGVLDTLERFRDVRAV